MPYPIRHIYSWAGSGIQCARVYRATIWRRQMS